MKKHLIFILLTFILGGTLFMACKKAKEDNLKEDTVVLSTKQREELKHDINYANRKSPFAFGTFGIIKHMALKGQHMRMFVELSPYFYKVDKIRKEPKLVKKSLLDNLALMDDSFDPLFYKLGKYRVGLRLELGSENVEGIMEVYISPDELSKLSKSKQKDVNPNQVLKNHVALYNVSLPDEVYNKSDLTSVKFSGEYIQYSFSIEEPVGNEMNRLRSGKMVWAKQILKSLHNSTDSAVINTVSLCRKAQRSVSYRFTGEDSGQQVTIFFNLSDL